MLAEKLSRRHSVFDKPSHQEKATSRGTVSRMKPRSGWISDSRVWLGLGVLAFCIVMPVYTSRIYAAIAARQATADGTITDHETIRFGHRYRYIFSVDGRWFSGWKTSPKNDFAFGTPVRVYYDSQNPNENALTDFGEMSRSPFTSLAHWWEDQKPHGLLIGGGLFLFLAVVGAFTGEALGRGGTVYRDAEPKKFWLLVVIEGLAGVFLIGLYLGS